MISFRLSKQRWLLLLSTSFLLHYTASAQWEIEEWKDPVDVGNFDLADNKLLLYNLIGVGIAHLISKDKNSIKIAESYNQLQFNYYQEYRKQSQPIILDLKYRKGKKWKKGIWLGVESMVYAIQDDENWASGLGLSPFFAWNMINSEKFRLSFDSGVGPVYFFKTFPLGGTKFNFSTSYGLELEWSSTTSSYSLGVSNTHFSNAFIAGRDRNPAFDGAGISFSLRLK